MLEHLSIYTFFWDNIFHLDVHYVCVQRFEPQGRRFTNFHYNAHTRNRIRRTPHSRKLGQKKTKTQTELQDENSPAGFLTVNLIPHRHGHWRRQKQRFPRTVPDHKRNEPSRSCNQRVSVRGPIRSKLKTQPEGGNGGNESLTRARKVEFERPRSLGTP